MSTEFHATLFEDLDRRFQWNRRQELVGVPWPELAESPSSWITRSALAQGTKVADLIDFLSLPNEQDFDMSFVRTNLRRLAARCGLQASAFTLMLRMFGNLQRIDKAGRTYLLDQDGFPRYRYCRQCLAEQRTNFFPIHWRFKAWRWCPEHASLLRDRCPHCEAIVVLPNDQLESGAYRRGIASIGQCFVCGGSLYQGLPVNRFESSRENFGPTEKMLLNNGRAVLAAIFHGYLFLHDKRTARDLKTLNALAEAGCLPIGEMHYEKAEGIYIKYRHPRTHELVHLNKEPAIPTRTRPWMGGLFDG